ncbi:MAG: hypothetical protein GF401_18795 [Chitinivibrionales bacterium]|nr:hypothetical protein [Chitinivibrionales bacterium]
MFSLPVVYKIFLIIALLTTASVSAKTVSYNDSCPISTYVHYHVGKYLNHSFDCIIPRALCDLEPRSGISILQDPDNYLAGLLIAYIDTNRTLCISRLTAIGCPPEPQYGCQGAFTSR